MNRSAATSAARPASTVLSRPRPSMAARTPEGAVAAVSELKARISQMQRPSLDEAVHPTLPALAASLPGGAVKQGVAYSVEGSPSLAMAMLAAPSAAGSWCAVVGVPDFGAESAALWGVDLERLVVVPHPGEDWLAVTAALLDVVSIVVAATPGVPGAAEVSRLSARLRQRGATLVVLGTWPQSEATLRLRDSSWSGIGRGHGHLGEREATLEVRGRGGALHSTGTRLRLPTGSDGLRAIEQGAAARSGDRSSVRRYVEAV